MKKVKSLVFMLLGFIFLTSCEFKIETQKAEEEPSIQKVEEEHKDGGDSDDHGCKASAGYTWSQIKGECIRLFEDGKRYNPKVSDSNEAVISAFVVYGIDLNNAELFLPNLKKSVQLSKDEEGNYSNSKYLVNDSIIQVNKKPMYWTEK